MTAERAPRRALQQVKPTKPTKLRPRVVYSDDFLIDDQGEEICPHAGETVTFRPRIRPDDLVRLLRLQEFRITGDNLADEMGGLEEVRDFLAQRISATDWTDDEGEVYANPAAMLADADFNELGWLLTKVLPERGAADQGEGSGDSTTS